MRPAARCAANIGPAPARCRSPLTPHAPLPLPPSLSGDESIPFSSQHVAVRTLYNYPPYSDLKATIAEELLAHLPPPAPPPPPTRITPVAEQMLLEEEAAAAADGDGADGVDAAAEFGDAEEGAFATAPSSDFSGGGAFADFA